MTFSLRTKLFVLTTAVVALLMASVTYFFTIRELAAKRRDLEASSARLARAIATMQLVDRQDWRTYQSYVTQLMPFNDDIVYVAIYDDRRALRAHALNPRLVDLGTTAPLDRRVEADLVRRLDAGAVADESRNDLHTAAVDIQAGDRVLGSVRVGFSLIDIAAELRRGVMRNVALGAVFVLVSGLLSFVLSRRLTGPIERLSGAMDAIAAGDLEHRVEVESRDEIGRLARAFNRMVIELRENAHLRGELAIARAVQAKLLPRATPRVAGYGLDGVCVPAHEVGGDYFDYFPLAGGRLGVAIADVAGKGTAAAFYMAELKGMMLALTGLHDSPRRCLVELNQRLYHSVERRVFATMIYGVLDPREHRFTFARAGHSPLVAFGRGGGVEGLAPRGLALGLEPGKLFERVLEEHAVSLTPGAGLLLHTDGVTDAMDGANQPFGEARLHQLVLAAASFDPGTVRERLLEAVAAHAAGREPFDDQTLVVIRRDPSAPADGTPESLLA